MYATSDVEDALDATREFLLPFEWSKWWRLAVVALFVSSGTAMNPPTTETGFPGSVGGSAPADPTTPDISLGEVPFELWLLAGAIVAGVLAIGLLLAIIGAVMEFVLVESLRNEQVTIRRYFKRRWGQGLRLFAFNLLVGIGVLALGAGLVGLGIAPFFLADSFGLTALVLVLLVPVFLALAIITAAIFGFTSSFVVPTMVVEDCGVLDGWRRFWPVLRREWKEYLAYALVYVALLIVIGIAASFAALIGAILLAIPFALVAAVGVALLGIVDIVGFALLGLAGVAWLLSVIVLFAFVQVPIVTYLRYYSLFVLGDTEETLDIIAERRAAVRSAE